MLRQRLGAPFLLQHMLHLLRPPPALRSGAALGLTALLACSVQAQPAAPIKPAATAGASAIEVQARAMRRASDAVLGLRTRAVPDSRSAATLGSEREGSGVVISRDGLVLTIGYLVLEAEQVDLVTDEGRKLPARVVAYDQATGLGLVQALLPLALDPVPLGDPSTLRDGEPLVVASGGPNAEVSTARLADRRPFSASWEYHLERALFTTPPRQDHPGAALFNARGELLGIGSLLLPDVAGPGAPRLPGNLFVPADVLPAILQDLLARGRSTASQRPWLGVNCVESAGQVHVMRVTPDSPADVAGLQRGDRILRIDGVDVGSLSVLWKTLWATPPSQRPVTLQIEREAGLREVVVHAVDRALTLKRPEGI
jgi:S1-C subfamily serine protease